MSARTFVDVRNPEPPLLPAWGSFNDVLLSLFAAEACVSFFEAFAGMASGNKAVMNFILSKFEPTGQEREAFEKLQECYNGLGLSGKFLDAKVMVTSPSPHTPRQHMVECCVQMIHAVSNVCQGIDKGALKPLLTLSHVNAACLVHILPVLCKFLQLTPTGWVNRGSHPQQDRQ